MGSSVGQVALPFLPGPVCTLNLASSDHLLLNPQFCSSEYLLSEKQLVTGLETRLSAHTACCANMGTLIWFPSTPGKAGHGSMCL